MEWFEQWFGEEYLLVYSHRDIHEAEAEVAAIQRFLGLHPGTLVLDLCCGPGRHDTALARLGLRIYGLDFSLPLLKAASEAIPVGAAYPRYIRGDARRLPFSTGTFDAVLNLFTSFGYFTDRENEDLLRTIARILKPGGVFYIDYLNPPRVLATLIPLTEREHNGIVIREERSIDETSHRVEKTITITRNGSTHTFHESVRLYSADNMRDMIDRAGLSLTTIAGSVAGEPHSTDSPRMILHGIRRSDR